MLKHLPLSLAMVLLLSLGACAPAWKKLPIGDYSNNPVNPKAIALTFDDGPNEPYTSQILDILKANKVKATFFVCGLGVERHPKAVKRMAREGHEVGNHTYSHGILGQIPAAAVEREILMGDAAITKVLGKHPTLMRPPQFSFNSGIRNFTNKCGYAVIFRSVTSLDWQTSNVEAIKNNVIAGVHGGDIVLFHDGLNALPNQNRSATVAALPAIIANLKQRGFNLVTVSQLFSDRLPKTDPSRPVKAH